MLLTHSTRMRAQSRFNEVSTLAQRLAEGLDDGLGQVLEDGALAGFDFDGGGHAGLDFELFVPAAAELAAAGAHLGAVVGLFALAQVFAQGVGADVGKLA